LTPRCIRVLACISTSSQSVAQACWQSHNHTDYASFVCERFVWNERIVKLQLPMQQVVPQRRQYLKEWTTVKMSTSDTVFPAAPSAAWAAAPSSLHVGLCFPSSNRSCSNRSNRSIHRRVTSAVLWTNIGCCSITLWLFLAASLQGTVGLLSVICPPDPTFKLFNNKRSQHCCAGPSGMVVGSATMW
jgi:hypothetical protein